MSDITLKNKDWAVHPAVTIDSVLLKSGLSIRQWMKSENIPDEFKRSLFSRDGVSEEFAEYLEFKVGGSKGFWKSRYSNYRECMSESRSPLPEEVEWIKHIPYKFLSEIGLVRKGLKGRNRVFEALSFFDVRNIEEWRFRYEARLSTIAFKASDSIPMVPEAVITWLHVASRIAMGRPVERWSRQKLAAQIPGIKNLTRIKRPIEFLPRLSLLLREAGVHLVVLRTPKGCPASGATFFIDDGSPVVLLSFRFLSDDQFWFAVFHELGHLLLHEGNEVFLEGVKSCGQEEVEANEFAESLIVPKEMEEAFLKLNAKEWKRIVRFAKKVGVSSGLILGQLQHKGLVAHNYLNSMKERYSVAEIEQASRQSICT